MRALLHLSPPFTDKELNGAHLLEEAAVLRRTLVAQEVLNQCAKEAKAFRGQSTEHAVAGLRRLAKERFADQPSVAELLIRWAKKVRERGDVSALVSHLERLALASAVLEVLWQVDKENKADRRG